MKKKKHRRLIVNTNTFLVLRSGSKKSTLVTWHRRHVLEIKWKKKILIGRLLRTRAAHGWEGGRPCTAPRWYNERTTVEVSRVGGTKGGERVVRETHTHTHKFGFRLRLWTVFSPYRLLQSVVVLAVADRHTFLKTILLAVVSTTLYHRTRYIQRLPQWFKTNNCDIDGFVNSNTRHYWNIRLYAIHCEKKNYYYYYLKEKVTSRGVLTVDITT